MGKKTEGTTFYSAGFWVFAYGSLMWDPDFIFDEQHPACLRGWSRRLCVYSHVYRGTPEHPGLVLGLDEGGTCDGMAFHIPAPHAAVSLGRLRAREMVSNVYDERIASIDLDNGSQVEALIYTADRHHAQYAGALPAARQLSFIRSASGSAGTSRDYVLNTWRHLQHRGIADPGLDALARELLND
jgi:glutathione-specific gamma-glutamylcyclotransferase